MTRFGVFGKYNSAYSAVKHQALDVPGKLVSLILLDIEVLNVKSSEYKYNPCI